MFGTCELLEGVLSYLPLKDLFVLQRVSKQWGKVNAASPQLQEKMFLRLQSKIPQETWVIYGTDEPPYLTDPIVTATCPVQGSSISDSSTHS